MKISIKCKMRQPLAAPQTPPYFQLLPISAAMLSGLIGVSSPAISEEEKTLSTITVNATAEQTDGYRATRTRIGKVLQDPHDIPQAITTVTQKLIEEQGVNSLKQAMSNVSGVAFNAAEGGRSGDNMTLRGFYTFGDLYRDGIRDTAQYNREVFDLEQIDVLRGAAAMLFGRGQAGGVINLVSKTPVLYGISKASVAVGSYNYKEVKADINQRLGETTALRLNVMNRDEGSERKNPFTGTQPEIHRMGLTPSIAFGLGTNNELILSHLWMKNQDRADYGIPFLNGRPNEQMAKDRNYYGVDGNFDDGTTNVSTLSYLHKMSPETQWRTVMRASNHKRAYWAVAGQGALTQNSTSGQAKTRQFDNDEYVLQSDLNTKFKLAGMQHEFVTGFEYLHEDASRWSLLNLGTTNQPLYKPGVFSGPATTYKGDTYSAYVQDTVEFVKDWKITLGVRRDQMKATYSSTTSPKLEFAENSYRTGLSWQPNTAQHYYLSWSDSFSPTADLYQLSGGELPAERSQVSELGAKWLFMDGDLAFRTALFHANKDWERNTDLESTSSLLSKKKKTDGIEFELAGRVNDKLEIFAGLSLMRPVITEQNQGTTSGQTFAQFIAANGGGGFAAGEAADANELIYTNRYQQGSVGQRPRNTPNTTMNLWATYRFLPEWKAGLGFEAKANRLAYGVQTCGTASKNATTGLWSYTNCTNTFSPNTAPGYVRWDAMLTYDQPKYAVKLNIQNLLNKLYYSEVYDNGGFTVPGQGRRFLLSTELKF